MEAKKNSFFDFLKTNKENKQEHTIKFLKFSLECAASNNESLRKTIHSLQHEANMLKKSNDELKEENEKLKKQLDIEKTKSELLKDLKIKDIIELALQKMKELNNDK